MTELISLNSESATNRLVLLHGWGADAQDLLPVGKLLIEGFKDRFEILSLSAPQTHPSGIGRQWYPLYPHEWDKVPSAVLDLEKRLNTICFEKIPLNKTLLLGFSQGGAMALDIAKKNKFEGVFALSSYPHPEWEPLKDMPPVFLCHGSMDQVVPKEASQKSFNLLRKNGIESELYLFEGGHEINKDLIDHCRGIIKQKFLS
ncbi:esterase [Prochlorococcus marinus XMU1408]|uniref:Esterase n=2 Tax=Prochlorococcus marinus TaxID=1219 RepID=A0A318R574_PROMR|nr:esterase [Prochlorococcus marinus str. XMU1408]PYE03250.1 esterase [Prochlorococcus marinus XMU1408]